MKDPLERQKLLKERRELIRQRSALTQEAQAEFQAAEQAYVAARQALVGAKQQSEALRLKVMQIERQLEQIRPDAIQRLERQIAEELDRVAKHQPNVRHREEGRRRVVTLSESPSHRARTQALHVARNSLSDLCYESASVVESACAKVMSSLPAIAMEEV